MKYLSDYMQEAQTQLFKDAGAFFAFSKGQLEEGMKNIGFKEGDKLVDFGGGGFVLKRNFEILKQGLETIRANAIKQDLKENGVDAIISRECGNYEVQISGRLDDVRASLEGYGISEEQIQAGYNQFYQLCVENDWF